MLSRIHSAFGTVSMPHFELEISNLKLRASIFRAKEALILSLTCGLLVMITGCKTPTHAEAKVQAEQRWSHVRGQVKLQLARQQFERGHFEDTIKTLQEAATLDPTSAESYALLAKANLELGKSTTAEEVLGVATNLGLSSSELHYLQGLVLEQRNELVPALAQYEKAATLDPTKAAYVLAQVETLVALDRLAEAIALADGKANQFDDDASVALLGARITALAGDAEGALERFQNPAIQNAGSRVATEELGLLLAGHGRCTEAIRILKPLGDVVEGPEMSAGARRSLAECYLKENEAQLALGVLSEYAATHPNDKASQTLVAKAALAVGEYMTGLQALEQARRGGPPSAELDLLLAATHWKRNDLASAESVLDHLLATNPRDVEAWCLKGEILLESQRDEEAREAFERALELEPGCVWAGVQLNGWETQKTGPKRFSKKNHKKS